jgi:hypothetical protein
MAVIALAVAGTQVSAGDLRAGAARVPITPTPDEFPYVVYGEHDFVGVHDDTFVRALVLDDGSHRIAIISAEVTTIPNPGEVVSAVAQAAKLSPGNVMVLATHTHNVPLVFFHGERSTPTQQIEMQRLQKGAVDATVDAIAQLQPAQIGFARGQAFVNVNNGEQAGLATWYDPKGFSDKSLDVIRVQTRDGRPLALVLNYASHGEVMFRSVTRNGGYESSGDLPGAVSRILEAQSNGAPVVLFTAAAEGDQHPLFKSLQPAAQLPATDEGAAGWGLLDLIARRLSAAAIDTVATMDPGTASVSIGAAAGSAVCPGQHYVADRETHKVARIDETPPVTIPLVVFRINNILLDGVGADLASELGRAVRQASPSEHTSVMTMLAGAIGYVLPDASYVNPGHGAIGSPVKPGCARSAIIPALRGLAQQAGR